MILIPCWYSWFANLQPKKKIQQKKEKKKRPSIFLYSSKANVNQPDTT